MNEISTKLVDSLKTLGMTEYEAKVYSALVLFDRSEVKQIYEYLNMPKPSVYQSLKRLMDNGLVMLVNSKPAIYRATPPKIALRHLMDIHQNARKNALIELEYLEKSGFKTESPEIIWTLFGNNNVDHSLEELISKAKKSMKLILPSEYMDFLSLVNGSDLKIELIMFEKDSSILNRYNLRNLFVHDGTEFDVKDLGDISQYLVNFPVSSEEYSKFLFISVDNDEFMYVPPFSGDTKSGITSKNQYILTITNIIFSAAWKHTPEVKLESIE
jgi:sugar-specific transcriptional regulator TrmB